MMTSLKGGVGDDASLHKGRGWVMMTSLKGGDG